jgi:glycyl-tRNA synthetase
LAADLETQADGVEITTGCGKTFTIEKDFYTVAVAEEKVSVNSFYPHVIEPAFGLGRILYAVLEHAYNVREGRACLSLHPSVAPIKVALLPLSKNADFDALVADLRDQLISLNLASTVDNSNTSIGRKYARADEIGVPFALTLDFESTTNKDVTVRDRDSLQQIRVSLADAPAIVARLVTGALSWTDAYATYPQFHRPDDEEDKAGK